jgi:hypothetical protein
LEYKAFSSRITVSQIRSFVTYVINQDLNKAVDLGIIDFSLREGILLEDLVISQEEDFTFNQKLLEAKKIALKLSSVFSSEPYIKKITVIGAKVQIDIRDDFFPDLVNYLLKARIQEVEFRDIQVELYDGENLILNLADPTVWRFQKKGNQILFEFSNGFYFIPFLTRIHGTGEILLEDEKSPKILLRSEWKNLNTDQIPGLSLWMTGFQFTEGSGTGSLEIRKDQNWEVHSQGIWENADGKFLFLEELDWEGWEFQHDFTLTLDPRKDGITQSIRNIQNQNLDLAVQWNKEKDLESGTWNWKIKRLDQILRFASGWRDKGLAGDWSGSLVWKETGARNNWFLISGNSDWIDGRLNTFDSSWSWKHWKVEILENSLRSSFDGKLFDSGFRIGGETKLQFWKSIRPDKTNYYPLGTAGKFVIEIDSLPLDRLIPIYERSRNIIEREIKERQEKIIPEEFFTQFKSYKYFLEEMNLDFALQIKKVIAGEKADPKELDNWKGTASVKSGRANFLIQQIGTGNRIDGNSQFGTKTPYLELGLKLESFPWGREIGKICGIPLIANSLDLEYKIRTRGSDFYNLSKQANHSSVWNVPSGKFRPERGIEKKLPEGLTLLGERQFSLSWELDRYFETSYYRNISIQVDPIIDLKGYGNSRGLYPSFSFYGKVKDENRSGSFMDDGTRCR